MATLQHKMASELLLHRLDPFAPHVTLSRSILFLEVIETKQKEKSGTQGVVAINNKEAS